MPAVKTELPQLFDTETVGAVGTVLGAAVPLPAGLTQPFIVCVTVRVTAVVTLIDAVVAPVFHINAPVYPPAVNTELPQLSTTVTEGAAGITNGAALPLPDGLIQPLIVCVTV